MKWLSFPTIHSNCDTTLVLGLDGRAGELEYRTINVLGIIIVLFRTASGLAFRLPGDEVEAGEDVEVVRVEQVEAVPEADHLAQDRDILASVLCLAPALTPPTSETRVVPEARVDGAEPVERAG